MYNALFPWRHSSRIPFLLIVFLIAASCAAQENPAPDRPQPAESKPAQSPSPAPDAAPSTEQSGAAKKTALSPHRFWDTQNRWLFAGVAAARTLDGTSTRNFRARGRDEGLLNNEIVDNAPAFAAIEFAGTIASIATSYWMHRTGHHKLERWVSYLHIGVGVFGDARNYALPSVHRPPAVP